MTASDPSHQDTRDKAGEEEGNVARLGVVHELAGLDEEPGNGQEGERCWRNVIHGGDGVERQASSLQAARKDYLN